MGTTVGFDAMADIDLLIAQGADFTCILQYQGVDVSAWTAHAQVRGYPGGPIWADLTKSSGITLAADGTVTVKIPAATTTASGWNDYQNGVWDLMLTDTGGDVYRFAAGKVTVVHSVSR